MNFEPWQDRVIQERDDLQIRWNKLDTYKRDDRFADLNVHNRRLLLKQWMIMSAYLEVLNERIKLFGGPVNEVNQIKKLGHKSI